MKRYLIYLILAAMAIGAGFTTHYALNSPRYALYQIGSAVYNRDPQRFLAYVNVDRIMVSQSQDLPALFGGGKKNDNPLAKSLGSLLQGLLPSLSMQIKQQVAKAVADPKRQNLSSSWDLMLAAHVTRNGDYALVVLSHPQERLRLRLGMQRPPESHWQVVQINSQDLAALAKRYFEENAKAKP